MKFFLLFFLEFVISIRAPLPEVADAARANDIVPTVIPSLSLTTHLFVNYTQPAGDYVNCDTQYYGDAKMFSLNDTGITYTLPWDTRSYRPTQVGGRNDFFQYTPEIVWEAENTTWYTLMMVDPLFIIDPTSPFGPYLNHYLVINIVGNNISTGDVVNGYLGPGAADANYHKYTFALYAQPNGMLNLTANQTTQIEQRVNFNVTTFLIDHNLTDAAGVNWMFTAGDAWGPVEQNEFGLSKLDCFVPVEDAARERGIVPSVLPALNLTTRLTVSYNQPPGNFTNCDQLYVNPGVQFRLNDTGSTIESPWNARSYRPFHNNLTDYTSYQPDVTWNSTANTSYTLVMVDAGSSVNRTFTAPLVEHWMVVNIPGNNLAAGEVINPLLGPAPIDQSVHTYTFVLYEQAEIYIVLSPEEIAAIQTRRNFSLTNFAQIHNLSAPVGVNWLYSSVDAWSPVVQDALNISKLNCLGPVEDAARANGIVPIVVPMVNLSTRLFVNFSQPAGDYINCGQTFQNNASAFSLNDTGVTYQTPWNTRSYRNSTSGPVNASDLFLYAPTVTWTPQVATLYTLLMVDPLFILNSSSTWGPYVEHYMVLNIIGNNISTGTTVNPYLGPAPTDANFHKYVFLVYPQTGIINLDDTERQLIQLRTNFNLTTFLNMHNYTSGAIGINWVYATADSWAAVEQDALGLAKLDCFGPVERAARDNGMVPQVVPALNLTTRLSVQFNQPKDSYVSCNNLYSGEAVRFNLSDTSVTNNTPWNMRSYRPTPAGYPDDYFQYAPEVHWVSEPNALYTLMMVDAVYLINPNSTWGPYVQHWMAINIPANDTSKGDLINPFLGPAPFEPNTYHKYTYVLYKQEASITLGAAELLAIQQRFNFNLTTFINAHNLSGANGINWGWAMVDPWALVELDAFGWMELDCFSQVQNTSRLLGIVPAIIPQLDLDTQLQVTFTQPVETYVKCDSKITPVAFNQSLSDIDAGKVYQTPWNLRSYRTGPNKTTAITAYAPAISWEGITGFHRYTLLVVDPVYLLNSADPNGPFLLHYLVTNINNTDLRTGTTITPYFGPAPLDSLYHKYLFLLYRHTQPLNFTAAQITQLQGRVKFDLNGFRTNHSLGNPVGINWAFAQADEWSLVAQDYIGFLPLVCPNSPTPAGPSGDSGYVHLTPGAFAAICVIGGLIILGLVAYLCYLRSATKRKVGTGYNALPGEGGVRKTSVNREK